MLKRTAPVNMTRSLQPILIQRRKTSSLKSFILLRVQGEKKIMMAMSSRRKGIHAKEKERASLDRFCLSPGSSHFETGFE